MILFNETPQFQTNVSEEIKKEILNNGYALPDDDLEISSNNSALLHFMNVENHIDGNGLSVLWIVNGNGTFFIENKEYKMSCGDVLVFDDNIEHGFFSDEICSAMNFTINDIGLDLKKIKELVKNYNQDKIVSTVKLKNKLR